MKKSKLVLVTATQVREIFESAFAFLDTFEDDGDDHEERARLHLEWVAAKQMVRFCCATAMLLDDPSLIDIPFNSLGLLEFVNDDMEKLSSVAAASLSRVLSAGAPVDDDIRELATSDDEEVREAIAEGLSPADEDAKRLLQKLAADPNSSVRAAARKSLAGREEIPWWSGKFDTDPVVRMSTEEEEATRGALQKLSQLLDKPEYEQRSASAEIVRLSSALPPPLALEVLRNVMRSWNVWCDEQSAIGSALLRLPGGLDGLMPLLEEWAESLSSMAADFVVKWASALEPPERERFCTELFDRISKPATKPTETNYRRTEPLDTLAEVCARLWPKTRDVEPLVDAVVEAKEEPPYCLKTALEGVLERKDLIKPALLERIAEAKVAGYPGGWSRVRSYELDQLVDKLPDAPLRRFAEQAARSEEKELAQWGWDLLAGRLHDAKRDGPRAKLLRRLFDDPKTRPYVLSSDTLRRAAFALIRRALRAGTLDYEGATSAIDTISSCYGGMVGALSWSSSARETKPERLSAGRVPRDLQGPPTEEEWQAYRRVRDPVVAAGDGRVLDRALLRLPPGPWSPADRYLVDRVIAEWRAEGGLIGVAYLLASKPTPDAAALFDEIMRNGGSEDSTIRRCHRACLREMGLKPPASSEDDEPGDSGGEGNDGWGEEEDA